MTPQTLKIQNILQKAADTAEKALGRINDAITPAKWHVTEYACESYAEAEKAGHEPWESIHIPDNLSGEALAEAQEKKWQKAKAEWLNSEKGKKERALYADLVVQREAAQAMLLANETALGKMTSPNADKHFVSKDD